MQLPQYILLSLLTVAFATEKCHFSDTVDLTNQTRFPNGSYLLQGRYLIPADKVANYSYRLASNQQKEPADLHVRGCVCDPTQQKYCVRLCCENGDMFNVTSSRCEKMPKSTNMPTDLEIRLKTNAKMSVNIFQHFVHQVALPCRNPVKVVADEFPWHLWENGTLHTVGGVYHQLDTVNYCITPHRLNNSDKYILTPMSCPPQAKGTGIPLLRTYGMIISVVFLIPTIGLYCWMLKFHIPMIHRLFTVYLVTMAVGYTIVSHISISESNFSPNVCQALGFTGYFFFTAIYMCVSVIGHVIYTEFICYYKLQLKRSFLFYALCVGGSAGLMTAIVVWAQLSDQVAVDYKPGIGEGRCWLDTTKWSAVMYFYASNSIIMLVNIIIFVSVCTRIVRVRRSRIAMGDIGDMTKMNVLSFMRIFLLLGLTWTTDILAYFFRNYRHAEFMFVLSDLLHAIRGILIFLLFIVKPDVRHKLVTIFSYNVDDSPDQPHERTTTVRFSISKDSR